MQGCLIIRGGDGVVAGRHGSHTRHLLDRYRHAVAVAGTNIVTHPISRMAEEPT
jgi:hypothetical protein